jgi:hypothetical protein
MLSATPNPTRLDKRAARHTRTNSAGQVSVSTGC